MNDLVFWVRVANVVLLGVLLGGLIYGWWRHRREPLGPQAIATFGFAIALFYGSGESIFVNSPPGGRPIVLLAATLVALACVYVPLHAERFRRRRSKEPS